MKQLFLIVAFSLLAFSVIAQEIEVPVHEAIEKNLSDTLNSSRLILNIGPTLPLGTRDSESFGYLDYYWTKPGGSIIASYARDLHKHFSLGLSIGIRANPVDKAGYIAAYNKEYSGIEEIKEMKSDPWFTAFMLTDLYVQLPIKEVVFYSKLSYGLAYVLQPEQYAKVKILVPGQEKELEAKTRTTSATGLAYGLSVGTRYEVGRFGIGAEVSWLSTKPESYHETQYEKYNVNLTEHKLSSVSCTLLLSYNFK